MTSAARRYGLWVAVALVIVTGTATAVVTGRTGEPNILTASTVWVLGVPFALAATFAVALACARQGSRRLGLWILSAAVATMLYWLASSLTGALGSSGWQGSWTYGITAAVESAGWMVILALVQVIAVVAGEEANLLARRRWPKTTLLGAASALVLLTVLVPAEDESRVLAAAGGLLASPVVRLGAQATVYVWMVGLLAAPVILLRLATRAGGAQRSGLVRIALGSVGPVLIVLLCGLLSVLLPDLGATGSEAGWLALGFVVGLPSTCGWLSATVRDSTSVTGPPLTSTAGVLRGGLWLVYVLGATQLIGRVAPLLGGGSAAGAVAMGLTIALTGWPWHRLVLWCVTRTDTRAAIAAATIASARPGAEAALSVCRRVVVEALGDPEARVLLAGPAGPGDPSPASGSLRLVITDAAGRPLGSVEHRTRFSDLRSLAVVLRPLFERAVFEAELREQASLLAAASLRADEAATEARRRIERDLHDGVQGRLVSLGLGLSLARDAAPDPVSRDVLDGAVSELHHAVAELRELSTGTLSSRLTGGGLAIAVGDLVERAQVPVQLDVPAVRLPPVVENTAYFVIAESLTNALKHAAAEHICVRVVPGDVLTVTVLDDGRGGADVRNGTGLRGLRERVHNVGGYLLVSDRLPHGTSVEAVLPCGS